MKLRGITQSRTGRNGTCFRSCLATIFGLYEHDVPDWPRANEDSDVNRWLGRIYGLRYIQIPIVPELPAPVGLHTIEGTSPRGGQHAVVGYNGRMVWDPHPQDGTGRGLVKPRYWGLLLPAKNLERPAGDSQWRASKEWRNRALDAASLYATDTSIKRRDKDI